MDKIYLVSYSTGYSDDYHVHILFATTNKKKATKYVTKFNGMLKKWKTYYEQYEKKVCESFSWYDENADQRYYRRWMQLTDTGNAFWQEVKIR